MTEVVGQFVVFGRKRERCWANLEHVTSSSDLQMSFSNLKSKRSDKTSGVSCYIMSSEGCSRNPNSRPATVATVRSQLARMGSPPWRRDLNGPLPAPSSPNRSPFCSLNISPLSQILIEPSSSLTSIKLSEDPLSSHLPGCCPRPPACACPK